MHPFSAYCDDFYFNMGLTTEIELPKNRETILHYFEQIKKKYPEMKNLFQKGESFNLEESKREDSYRWTRLMPRMLDSGCVNPESIETAIEQHKTILELAPYALSVSPLDCDGLELTFGFDITYQGNQNQLIANALGLPSNIEKALNYKDSTLIYNSPSFIIALEKDLKTQLRIAIEARNSFGQMANDDYSEEDQFSILLSIRHFGCLDNGTTYIDTFDKLTNICQNFVDTNFTENILIPLSQAAKT